MKRIRPAVIATLLSTAAILPAHGQEAGKAAQEISIKSVSADIAQLDKDIAEAEADAAQYEGGLVHVLALARVETLKLTRAIMQNRIEAQRGGAVIELSVPAMPPNPERAAQLLQEIETQTAAVEEATQEAANAGGLVGALALSPNFDSSRLIFPDFVWRRSTKQGVLYREAVDFAGSLLWHVV